MQPFSIQKACVVSGEANWSPFLDRPAGPRPWWSEVAPSLLLFKKHHLELLKIFLPTNFFHSGRVEADDVVRAEGASSSAGRRELERAQTINNPPSFQSSVSVDVNPLVGLHVDEGNR